MSMLRTQIEALIAQMPEEKLPQLLAILQKMKHAQPSHPDTMALVAKILAEDANLLHRLAQ